MKAEEQIASLWALGGLTWRQLLPRVWRGIEKTDLLNRGYELAFNFLLAVFPLLLFLISLIGLFASRAGELQTHLFSYIQLMLPPDASLLVSHTLHEVTEHSGTGKATIGLIFALWAGSAGMTQLISTLNAAYEVTESRSWIRVHLTSVVLTLTMAVLMIAALALVLVGSQVVEWVAQVAGVNMLVADAVKVMQWALAMGFVILAFAVIYYFAPDVKGQHWYWITPGSVVGVGLWMLASTGMRIYLRFFDTYGATYGSLGAVIILMLWFYITGLAMLVGGQINATIEHAAAEHGHPEAKAAGERVA